MAVPRNRNSNARKNSKRSHHAKKAKNLCQCAQCSAAKLPHRICPSCGSYDGKVIISKEIE